MNRLKLLCLVVVLLLSSSLVFAKDPEYLSGSIVDMEGNATKISRIRADGVILGTYKAKDMRIDFAKLKKLENLGERTFRVTNKADKQFDIKDVSIYSFDPPNKEYRQRKYHYLDEISMEEKTVAFKVGDIHTLTFGTDIGRLKFNQRTKQYFPSDYIYDPFSAEKLVWKDPAY